MLINEMKNLVPTLLSSGRMKPRKVVGTVDTSEFVVALAASLGFLLALSFAQIPWQIVGALLLGGIVSAPLAAFVVRALPARILGTAVAGVILITNMRTFMGAVGLQAPIEVEQKARYQRRDVERWAEYNGAPLRYRDPFCTLKTMRAAMFFGNDRLHAV